MLRIGANGAGKTEMMYSANMSYRQIQKYLKFLVAQGLVDEVEVGNPSVAYVVTDRGHTLRQSIEAVLDALNLRQIARKDNGGDAYVGKTNADT